MSELAERLWDARRRGTVLDPQDIVQPTSLEEAYAIQAQVTRLSSHAVLGFKVGSTSKEAQQLLGTTEPASGPILEPYLLTSPAVVPVVTAQMPATESEFAFRLGRNLPARAAEYTHTEVADAVEAVAGAIELVGTRIAGGLAGKGRFLVTADGGVNIALVTGPWTTDWRRLDLKTHRVAMRINGKLLGQGEGARALGDPMNVLVWLANQQSRFGRGLVAGDIVSTGTCTGLDRVAPGDGAAADFGSLGQVELTLR
jgi:2-keto-4-pentenoate hydratase